MRLKNSLEDAVVFAEFCIKYGFKPNDVAELMTIKQRYALERIRYSGGLTKDKPKLGEMLTEKAADMGLVPDFTSSYCVAFKDKAGTEIRLPLY